MTDQQDIVGRLRESAGGDQIIDAEKRLYCAHRGFPGISATYRKPEQLADDLKLLLAEVERLRELADDRKRRINEMRNAFPEILNEMSALQKKYAFTFRDERTKGD